MGAHRVPISPKGIRGPEGARKKKINEVEPSEYVCTSMHTCLPRRGNNLNEVEPSEICLKWVPR